MAQPINEQEMYIYTEYIILDNMNFIYYFPYIIDIQYDLSEYDIDFSTEFDIFELLYG